MEGAPLGRGALGQLHRLGPAGGADSLQAGLLQGGPDALAGGLLAVRHQQAGDAVAKPEAVVPRLVRCGQLQVQGEGGALAQLALHADGPAHEINDVFGDGHAQARALDLPGGVGDLPGKGIKDGLYKGLAHAVAVVGHDEAQAGPAGGAGPQPLEDKGDLPAGLGVLHGVGQEVDEYLVQPQLVAQQQLRQAAPGVQRKALGLGPGLGQHHGVQIVHQLGQAELGHVQAGLAALDLAHVQDVVDEVEQVLAGGGDLPGVLPDLLRMLRVPAQQHGEAHNGVHGGADVVGHVGQEVALGLVGGLGGVEGLPQGLIHLPLLGAVGEHEDELVLVLQGAVVEQLLEPAQLLGPGVENVPLPGPHPAHGHGREDLGGELGG